MQKLEQMQIVCKLDHQNYSIHLLVQKVTTTKLKMNSPFCSTPTYCKPYNLRGPFILVGFTGTGQEG